MPPCPVDVDIVTQASSSFTEKFSMVRNQTSPMSTAFSVKDFAKITKIPEQREETIKKRDHIDTDEFLPKTVNEVVQKVNPSNKLNLSSDSKDSKNNVTKAEVPVTVTMDPLDNEDFEDEIEEPVSPPLCEPGIEPVIVGELHRETNSDEIGKSAGISSSNGTGLPSQSLNQCSQCFSTFNSALVFEAHQEKCMDSNRRPTTGGVIKFNKQVSGRTPLRQKLQELKSKVTPIVSSLEMTPKPQTLQTQTSSEQVALESLIRLSTQTSQPTVTSPGGEKKLNRSNSSTPLIPLTVSELLNTKPGEIQRLRGQCARSPQTLHMSGGRITATSSTPVSEASTSSLMAPGVFSPETFTDLEENSSFHFRSPELEIRPINQKHNLHTSVRSTVQTGKYVNNQNDFQNLMNKISPSIVMNENYIKVGASLHQPHETVEPEESLTSQETPLDLSATNVDMNDMKRKTTIYSSNTFESKKPKIDENISNMIKKMPTPRKKYNKGHKEPVLPGLWELCRAMLHNPAYNPKIIHWEDLAKGTFRIPNLRDFYRTWRELRPKVPINYERLTRMMRRYEEEGILHPVPNLSCVYKFGPGASDWQPSGEDKLVVGDGRRPAPSQETWPYSRFYNEFRVLSKISSELGTIDISEAPDKNYKMERNVKTPELTKQENMPQEGSLMPAPLFTLTPLESSLTQFSEMTVLTDNTSIVKTAENANEDDIKLKKVDLFSDKFVDKENFESLTNSKMKNPNLSCKEISCTLVLPMDDKEDAILKLGGSFELTLNRILFQDFEVKKIKGKPKDKTLTVKTNIVTKARIKDIKKRKFKKSIKTLKTDSEKKDIDTDFGKIPQYIPPPITIDNGEKSLINKEYMSENKSPMQDKTPLENPKPKEKYNDNLTMGSLHDGEKTDQSEDNNDDTIKTVVCEPVLMEARHKLPSIVIQRPSSSISPNRVMSNSVVGQNRVNIVHSALKAESILKS